MVAAGQVATPIPSSTASSHPTAFTVPQELPKEVESDTTSEDEILLRLALAPHSTSTITSPSLQLHIQWLQ
jgi:hypothetical protein